MKNSVNCSRFFPFQREHEVYTYNIYFQGYPSNIYTKVRSRTYRSTHRRPDRRTKLVKTVQLCCKRKLLKKDKMDCIKTSHHIICAKWMKSKKKKKNQNATAKVLRHFELFLKERKNLYGPTSKYNSIDGQLFSFIRQKT